MFLLRRGQTEVTQPDLSVTSRLGYVVKDMRFMGCDEGSSGDEYQLTEMGT